MRIDISKEYNISAISIDTFRSIAKAQMNSCLYSVRSRLLKISNCGEIVFGLI